MLTVYGPDAFKQLIKDHTDEVWESLSLPDHVATAIAAGINPETQSWNQDLMRAHCFKCIVEENVTPFPINITRGQRTGKLPRSHQFIINLVCDCNLPLYAYVGDTDSSVKHTVQCHVCGDWYHNECVGFPDRSTIDGSNSVILCIYTLSLLLACRM